MRPWYLLPPRSKTTAVTPAARARSARTSPTRRARAVLSPSASSLYVDAETSVTPRASSTICA